MENEKQKIVVETIERNSELSPETKKQLTEQILKMNSQEVEFFLKAIQKANEKNIDIENEITKLEEIEKESFDDFRQIFSNLSNKLLSHQTDKQTEIDENKSEDILNKIKSL
jgi:hypothetical protein